MSRPTLTAPIRLRITAAAEGAVREGHPWVFSDSIREASRPGDAGELAVIFDRKDRFLALGLFDPDSPLRVRILHAGKPVRLDAEWWRGRIRAALDRRQGLFGPETTGYRLINGESDGWPGLVLDRYAGTLVLKLYTAAWLPRLNELLPLLVAETGPQTLVLRLSRNLQAAARQRGLEDGMIQPTAGFEAPFRADFHVPASDFPPVVFEESGLRFEADVVRGQKTGFFLDQRENRRQVGMLAQGAEVLNAFSFSGGFSLYSARAGARSVTDLDISPHALTSARRNFALNQQLPGVARARHEQIQADCFAWLAEAPPRLFDLVILDPPSLAKREHERTGAIQAYGRLVADGIRRVRNGGWLLAASCSAHVSEEEFWGAVRQAARRSGRAFNEVQTTGHAPDHPATFPEARYLKAIYLRF